MALACSTGFSRTGTAVANTDTAIPVILNENYFIADTNNLRLRSDAFRIVAQYAIINTDGTQSVLSSPLIANAPWRNGIIATGSPGQQVQWFRSPVQVSRPGDNLTGSFQTTNTGSSASSIILLVSNEPLQGITREQTNEVFIDLSGESTSAGSTWTDISLAGTGLEDLNAGTYAMLGYRFCSPTASATRMIFKNRELPVGNIPCRANSDPIVSFQRNSGAPYPTFEAPGTLPTLSVVTDGAESLTSLVMYLSRVV